MVQCEQAQISTLSHTTSTVRLKDQQEERMSMEKEPAAGARHCSLITWLKVFWALCKQKEKCMHASVSVSCAEINSPNTFSWNKVHNSCPTALRNGFTFWFCSHLKLAGTCVYYIALPLKLQKRACKWFTRVRVKWFTSFKSWSGEVVTCLIYTMHEATHGDDNNSFIML